MNNKMKKQNIFFLTIDSLRSDKCYGKNKSSFTPNIDKLISNGAYFTQAISSSDQTGTSLASIFTSMFPINTGLTHFNFSKETKTYFDIFSNNEYFTCGCFPDHDFFKNLISNFDESYTFEYNKLESWKNLSGGIGNKIISQLKSLEQKQPWVYVVHIMDLHNLFVLPNEFKYAKYGNDDYDRMLSFIDTWIGKFLAEVNLEKTLLVITSDHGSYIPVTGSIPDEIPTIQKIMKKGKNTLPFLEPIGLKAFLIIRKTARELRMIKLKNKLSEYELRSLNTRGNTDLFEETIRVPLLFVGENIPQKIISQQVRHVDIFPTISKLTNLQNDDIQSDGRSLVPLLNNEIMDESPAYIETGVTARQFSEKINPESLGQIIGVRTSKYKYLRNRKSQKDSVVLFDLEKDPQELHNIASENKNIVEIMENSLSNITKYNKAKPEELSNEEQQKAEELLKKLGYI